ncbi:TetR family transcriptional regulator [Nonomuraea sp. NPDC050556]|uniref:TetR family transcriptional regulator n=1 Tax=Nonomuraea sp. NPDC050556 TaxID=3364369 RepID=UPI00379DE5D3
MTDKGTRARILRTAQELFARQGWQATSIREIAEELGLTKTAVLYHFPTKADILATLMTPLLEDMEAALARLSTRWEAVESLVEVYLSHRELLSLVTRNLAAVAQEPVYQRWMAMMFRANELVAGESPSLAEQVRAIQVVAVLSDPVIVLTDAPTDELRTHILDGARRLLEPGKAGRPSAMTPEMVAQARRMREEGGRTAAEIAEILGVSRATLYRYF